MNGPDGQARKLLPILFVASALLLLVVGSFGGDLTNAGFQLLNLSVAWLILSIFRYQFVRKLVRWTLPAYTISLSLLALGSSLNIGPWDGTSDFRVSLYYDNPNLLGAALAVAAVANVNIVANTFSPPIWLIAMGAIFVTGSRLSAIALLAGLTAWLLLRGTPNLRMVIVGISLIVLLLNALIIVGSDGSRSQPATNLLLDSGSLQHAAWRKHFANFINIEPDSEAGPLPDTWADRLTASAGPDHSLVIYQVLGVAEADVPYVGSIYIRSDHPQSVVLSTHLSETTCLVSTAWQRCVTPVGVGDAKTPLQLRLQATGPSEVMDVSVWGAQLEVGTQPTTFEEKKPPSMITYLLARSNPATWLVNNGSADLRYQAFVFAWQEFLSSPLMGTGRLTSDFPDRFQSFWESPHRVEHPHNDVLHLLMTVGLVGTLAWLLVLGGAVAAVPPTGRRLVIPLVTTIAVLSLTDGAFFSSGVYYLFWIAIAKSYFLRVK